MSIDSGPSHQPSEEGVGQSEACQVLMLSRSAGTGTFSLPIKELKDKKEVLSEIPVNSNRAIKCYHQLGSPLRNFKVR